MFQTKHFTDEAAANELLRKTKPSPRLIFGPLPSAGRHCFGFVWIFCAPKRGRGDYSISCFSSACIMFCGGLIWFWVLGGRDPTRPQTRSEGFGAFLHNPERRLLWERESHLADVTFEVLVVRCFGTRHTDRLWQTGQRLNNNNRLFGARPCCPKTCRHFEIWSWLKA